MRTLPTKLLKKLQNREKNNAFRKLSEHTNLKDFSSNDYLGFANSKYIFDQAALFLEQRKSYQNGATGSRLLSGNHPLYVETEMLLAEFHNADTALIFNSGYDANIGFFSSVPQRGDIIFYDELIHASIRDGIQMGVATSYKFKHNDLQDLENKLRHFERSNHQEVYIATESVFSMDGDSPNIIALINLCKEHNSYLIIDEAHATGVYGLQGAGLLQQKGLEHHVFARINTFGKAMGCHGAVILGSEALKNYLINFSRSFIYTTGLPPHSLATIQASYKQLENTLEIEKLQDNIQFFNQKLATSSIKSLFIKSNSAIHCCVIPGNQNVKKIATAIQQKGFKVKPILSPTVTKGKERLRFCIHSFNTEKEIKSVLSLVSNFLRNDTVA